MEALVLTKGTTYVYNGRCYKLNRKRNAKSYFKCKSFSCAGSATEHLSLVHERSHSCSADYDEIESLRALKRTVTKAATTSSAIPDLTSDLLSTVSQSVAEHLGTAKSIQMKLYRAQRQNVPKIPTTCHFEVPPYFQTMTRDTIFLLPHVTSADNRMLIFGSVEDLTSLSKSATIHADGTFDSVPRGFKQLYSLHSSQLGCSFPRVYSLMTGKSSDLYRLFFRSLRNVMIDKYGLVLNPT